MENKTREDLEKRERYAFEILKTYIGITNYGQTGTDGLLILAHLNKLDSQLKEDAIKESIQLANQFVDIIESENKMEFVENLK